MKLVVTKDSKVVQVVELDSNIEFKQEFTVGRSPDCYIVIPDQKLSREHGQFSLQHGKLEYHVLSKNRLQTDKDYLTLGNGIVVQVGDYEIGVVIPQQVTAAPKLIAEEGRKKEDVDEFQELDDNKMQHEMMEETLRINEANAVEPIIKKDEIEPTLNLESAPPQDDFNFAPLVDEEKMHEEQQQSEPVKEESFSRQEIHHVPVESGDSTRVMHDFIRYSLVLKGSNIPFEKYIIGKPAVYIGRKETCDITLSNGEVSGQHAKLTLLNNSLYVEDLGSINGIFVNGERVNKHQLVEGDVFQVADVIFEVKVESDFIQAEKEILMPVDTSEDHTQEFSIDSSLEDVDEEKTGNQNISAFKSWLDKLPLGELKNNPKRLALYAMMSILLLVILFVDPESTEDQGSDVVVDNSEISTSVSDNSKVAPAPESGLTPVATAKTRTPEEQNFLESHYALAISYLEKGDYASAISEIDLVMDVENEYKDIVSLQGLARDGLAKLEDQERKRKSEEERIARQNKVEELIKKLEEAMKDQNLTLAEMHLNQIFEIDPENLKVTNLKMQLETTREEIKKKNEEEALKRERRKKMVAALAPGKNFFLQHEWYKAIIKLQDFLKLSDVDEDLIKEGSSMLQGARNNLNEATATLMDNARQYKASQDLKSAYESYNGVLKIDPGNDEANLESREIKDGLMLKARTIYREALINESISQFKKAKEKFQEVLLIAPSDSDYYKRAEDKLKKIYLE